MIITKEYGAYRLICDCCEGDCSDGFDRFYDAVEYAEGNGWQRNRAGSEWENICPDCQEGGGE